VKPRARHGQIQRDDCPVLAGFALGGVHSDGRFSGPARPRVYYRQFAITIASAMTLSVLGPAMISRPALWRDHAKPIPKAATMKTRASLAGLTAPLIGCCRY